MAFPATSHCSRKHLSTYVCNNIVEYPLVGNPLPGAIRMGGKAKGSSGARGANGPRGQRSKGPTGQGAILALGRDVGPPGRQARGPGEISIHSPKSKRIT